MPPPIGRLWTLAPPPRVRAPPFRPRLAQRCAVPRRAAGGAARGRGPLHPRRDWAGRDPAALTLLPELRRTPAGVRIVRPGPERRRPGRKQSGALRGTRPGRLGVAATRGAEASAGPLAEAAPPPGAGRSEAEALRCRRQRRVAAPGPVGWEGDAHHLRGSLAGTMSVHRWIPTWALEVRRPRGSLPSVAGGDAARRVPWESLPAGSLGGRCGSPLTCPQPPRPVRAGFAETEPGAVPSLGRASS
ncbi:uncharacterized protein LOC144367608 [Ictidomys tridecemlineatus]